MSFRHSEIITCLAKLKSCGLSFLGHSLQEWLWNDIFISLRSFPDGMIWNDNCPHPTGMTGMALEWLDWAQNDGMRRPPKRSFEFPSLSFLPHPVIPASSGNAVSMGMSLEWRRDESGRGTKVRYFPYMETYELQSIHSHPGMTGLTLEWLKSHSWVIPHETRQGWRGSHPCHSSTSSVIPMSFWYRMTAEWRKSHSRVKAVA